MRKMLFITLLMGGLCTTVSVAKAQERLPEYLQAEKYTQEKLNTMLFSTVVDPHWFQKGNNFWFDFLNDIQPRPFEMQAQRLVRMFLQIFAHHAHALLHQIVAGGNQRRQEAGAA